MASDLDEARLIAKLKQSLEANIFSGRLRITPRRVNQVAQEVAASFLQFQDREQEEAVGTYGQRLAREGVGHQAILSLTETLRQEVWESGSPDVSGSSLAGRYIFALLEGYMVGREDYLLQEQERTRRALERARERDEP